jgi:hypothetical protein
MLGKKQPADTMVKSHKHDLTLNLISKIPLKPGRTSRISLVLVTCLQGTLSLGSRPRLREQLSY